MLAVAWFMKERCTEAHCRAFLAHLEALSKPYNFEFRIDEEDQTIIAMTFSYERSFRLGAIAKEAFDDWNNDRIDGMKGNDHNSVMPCALSSDNEHFHVYGTLWRILKPKEVAK